MIYIIIRLYIVTYNCIINVYINVYSDIRQCEYVYRHMLVDVV